MRIIVIVFIVVCVLVVNGFMHHQREPANVVCWSNYAYSQFDFHESESSPLVLVDSV